MNVKYLMSNVKLPRNTAHWIPGQARNDNMGIALV